MTRRFPTLKIQFLECGVGWATALFAELVARWEKRNVGAIQENLELAKFRAEVGYSGRDEVYRWEAEVAKRQSRLFASLSRVARKAWLGTATRIWLVWERTDSRSATTCRFCGKATPGRYRLFSPWSLIDSRCSVLKSQSFNA